MRSASKVAPRGVGVWLVVGLCATMPARAAEYFVDNTSANCSNSGAGTLANPYCTISAALAARHSSGTIITVLPGHYREQVTVGWSGTSNSPITLRAMPGGPAPIVDGTDDFSSPALWDPFFGDVWLAASVTWSPRQVFADGVRLTASTADPLFLPPGCFRYVAGTGLYVNAGAGHPSAHGIQVGKRLYGFFSSGRSFVRIEGFTVQRAEERCIQVTNSHSIEILGNELRSSGRFGIQAQGDSAVRIAANVVWDSQGHGISLTNFTAASVIEDNESHGNADPVARTANGLYMFSASRNLIRRNRWHHNQDTGHYMSTGSNDNVSTGNLSWSNGDHGFDHVGSTGTEHVNDVAWGNFNDGFSLEGGSIDTEIHNCIAVENGATTKRFNLFVDSLSTADFSSDDNLFWNSTPRGVVRFANSVYQTVAHYSEMRDHDDRSVQADPLFVAPAAGDFHLQPHSPAIDNANTAALDWPGLDADGLPPSNDPGMPDIGLGPVSFADRGAFEFQGTSAGPNQPPVAELQLSPPAGGAPLMVRLDATGSSDPNGDPLTYTFDVGNGTVLGPLGWGFADHLFGEGARVVTVTVTDPSGASDTASVNLVVGPPSANQVDDPSFESGFAGWAPVQGAGLSHVTGGHTGAKAVLVTAPIAQVPFYGMTDQSPWVQHVPFVGSTYRARAWVQAGTGNGKVMLRLRETLSGAATAWSASPQVTLSGAWKLLELDYPTVFAGSSLTLEIVHTPWQPGSSFRIDDVAIEYLPGTGVPGGGRGPRPDGTSDGGEIAPAVSPNPMRADGASFRITTPRAGEVAVHLYDLAGRRVRTLRDPGAAAGTHVLRFDGRGDDGARLALGVYHYQVRSPAGVRTGRLVLVD